MICMNATEANLVQRCELQFPWQPAAASKAQTTGQKVRLALKGGTPAFSFQPWDENVSYIWSASLGIYF